MAINLQFSSLGALAVEFASESFNEPEGVSKCSFITVMGYFRRHEVSYFTRLNRTHVLAFLSDTRLYITVINT